MNAPDKYAVDVAFSVVDGFDDDRKTSWRDSYDSEQEAREEITAAMHTFLHSEIPPRTAWGDVAVDTVDIEIVCDD